MVYTPKAIANFFLAKAEAEGKKLTPLQVIKLVFIAHGWHLGLTGMSLVSEQPEAWKYGPVFPSLYRDLKRFGDEPVVERITDIVDYSSSKQPVTPPLSWKDPKVCNLLDQVWDEYSKFSGTQLSTITHQIDSPWELTWNQLDGKDVKGVVIPDVLIKDYYKALLSKNA